LTLSRIKNFCTSSSVYWLILLLGLAFRAWEILFYRRPNDWIISDASRHYNNGINFLDPGALGCADPVFYQFYLFLLLSIIGKNAHLIAIASVILSWISVFFWGAFAREVFSSKRAALIFTILFCFMPSFGYIFTLFISETTLVTFIGGGLWLSWLSVRKHSGVYFLCAVTCWLAAILSRPVALPMALISLLWSWIKLPRKLLVSSIAIFLISASGILASLHGYKHFYTYSPFGNNGNLAMIYFFSGKLSYGFHFLHEGVYGFQSPSVSYPTFAPFSDWVTFRSGNFDFKIDRNKKGADIREVLQKQISDNFSILPKLILENLAYFFFGPMWPGYEHQGLTIGRLVYWERWIWFPLIIFSLFYCTRMILKGFYTPLFFVSLIGVSSLICGQLAVMEGRYRKPIEPLVLLVCVYALSEHWQKKGALYKLTYSVLRKILPYRFPVEQLEKNS
jgi:hypothetical protein